MISKVKAISLVGVTGAAIAVALWMPDLVRYAFTVNADNRIRQRPVVDNPYADTRTQWVNEYLIGLMMKRQFAPLEKFFEDRQRQGVVALSGLDYFTIFERDIFSNFALINDQTKQAIEAWVNAYPHSPYALLTHAHYIMSAGWKERGKGLASQVKTESWPIFYQALAEAYREVQQVKSINPDLNDVKAMDIRLSLLLGKEKAADLAEKMLSSASDLHSDNLFAYADLQLYGLSGRWGGSTEAELAFARAVAAKAPQGSILPILVAWAHNDIAGELSFKNKIEYLKRPEVWNEVSAAYKKVIATHPKSVKWITGYADMAFESSHSQIAIQYLNLAYDIDPYYSYLYKVAGEMYFSDKATYPMAETNFKQYIIFNPNDEISYVYMGRMKINQAQYQDAMHFDDIGLRLNPRRCDLRVQRCNANFKLGHLDEALRDCSTAIEMNAYCKDAYQSRSEIYAAMGNMMASWNDSITYEKINILH